MSARETHRWMIGRFHTRGQTNRLDGQIVWHLSVWCEFMSYCSRLVRLDGQIVWEKSSFQTAKYQTICSSKNLFVPFSHQTICPSETICPSRRFVRPLVWKRPMTLRVAESTVVRRRNGKSKKRGNAHGSAGWKGWLKVLGVGYDAKAKWVGSEIRRYLDFVLIPFIRWQHLKAIKSYKYQTLTTVLFK